MAIAHANIGEIENFSKTISNQQETTYIVRDNFYSTISEAQVKIQIGAPNQYKYWIARLPN